ncbi:alcohol dehydrogenase catalytic domain-containing protein [Litorilinea aerophila]|uniref:Zinc-binding dehydrogenase n=1 Tax=Litorilinea aerophila TaxID=1204385 RepID=A0A540VHR3_9CHLR|nr:alcohol dehydrogenase catalytic domain-containing protein [Litorilinea aerophila]MCC9076286.1 alcohol dehydrogenase catalytic domain-containing protein [Litorilinea aerophila]GIV80028.1 MAG: Zn-dependent alcohol dehydrogenase [Litorilinea sp.]
MKAVFYEGDRRIRVGTCTPRPPGPNEVQIQVAYGGICGTDLHIFHGAMDRRVRMPQIMGHEMSGRVHAVGSQVQGIRVGDPVTVMPLDPCGVCPACQAGHSHICHNLKFLGIDTPGAFQSFWTVPAHTVFRLPETLSLQQAALIEPLAVACHDVRLGEVKAGDQVVVIGGGPIGTLIALVAREQGAHVLVSDVNPHRLALIQELGFQVVNPLEEDLPGLVQQQTNGAGADVVFEVSGSAAGARTMTELLRTRGLAVVVAIFGQPPAVDLFRVFWRELRLRGVRVYEQEDFQRAIELAASGRLPLDKLITSVRPLEQLQAGFEEMEQGGANMKILLEV